jgi:hypothetical protein
MQWTPISITPFKPRWSFVAERSVCDDDGQQKGIVYCHDSAMESLFGPPKSRMIVALWGLDFDFGVGGLWEAIESAE